MRAIVYRQYGSSDVLRLEDLPNPAARSGQVLVRNRASVVTAAECAARAGRPAFARLFFGLRTPKWPVLGSNLSGEVIALGEGVRGFAIGDRVSGVNLSEFGAHAEYVAVTAQTLVPTPAGLDHAEAVAVFDGALTAVPFLTRSAKLRAGQTILVNGAAGAVGSAAVQLAAHLGATVTAVCGPGNAELVRSLGAAHVIDYTADDFTARRSEFDVIFDAVGKSSFLRARRALKPGGIYLTTVPSLGIFVQRLLPHRAGRRAGIAFSGLQSAEAVASDLAYIAGLAAEGSIRPVIGASHDLAHAAESHRLVDTGHKWGSAVVTMGL
jgi:NADPH:quinone reductase-like Zn-dependent oxidoreductase